MPSTSQCYKHKYAEPDIFQQLNTSLEQTEKDAGGLGRGSHGSGPSQGNGNRTALYFTNLIEDT